MSSKAKLNYTIDLLIGGARVSSQKQARPLE